MQLNASLTFNGHCEEAFKFYQGILGGKIQSMMTWGESPMAEAVSAELKNKIVHASMTVGETLLMGGDAPPDQYQQPKGFSVTVQMDDPAEAERVFHALAENGTVTMPIQQTFWTVRFGMLTDKFGIPWMVNCLRPA